MGMGADVPAALPLPWTASRPSQHPQQHIPSPEESTGLACLLLAPVQPPSLRPSATSPSVEDTPASVLLHLLPGPEGSSLALHSRVPLTTPLLALTPYPLIFYYQLPLPTGAGGFICPAHHCTPAPRRARQLHRE